MFPIGGPWDSAPAWDAPSWELALTATRAERTSGGGYEWTRTTWHWNRQGALEVIDDEQATIAESDDLPGVGGLDGDGLDLP